MLPDQAVARAGLEAAARADPRARRLPAHRDADLRGHRALRPRRGRVDRHRPEGDVHLPGRRRALADAAPRGHRAGLPRLPRARHAQARPAGEALVPGQLLPPGEAAGRALPPVLAARRRGHRLRRPRRRRRDDRRCCTRCWASSTSRACACAWARWAASTRAPSTASASPPTCARNADRLSADVRDRIDLNPLRAFDAKDPGTQAVMRDAPLLLDSLSAEDREHFDEVCARLRVAGHRLGARRHARARHRLLHAHDLRVHLRRARRAVRRRRRRALRRARSSCSAARRRPAWAGRRASSGCCWRPASGPRPRRSPTSSSPTRTVGWRPSPWPPRRARPGSPSSRSWPGARSRASSSRQIAPAPATLPSWAPTASQLRDMDSGEQEDVESAAAAVARVIKGRHLR